MESAPKTLGMVVVGQKLRPLSYSHLAPGLSWVLGPQDEKIYLDNAHRDSVPRSAVHEAAGTNENCMCEPGVFVFCDVCLLAIWQT